MNDGSLVAIVALAFTSVFFMAAWWLSRNDAIVWAHRAENLFDQLAKMNGVRPPNERTVEKVGPGAYAVEDDGLIALGNGRLVDDRGFEYDPDTRQRKHSEA